MQSENISQFHGPEPRNRISQQVSSQTGGSQLSQVSQQIKQIIQKFYNNMPRRQLAQKVKIEIIPLLISLFFQGSDKNIPKNASYYMHAHTKDKNIEGQQNQQENNKENQNQRTKIFEGDNPSKKRNDGKFAEQIMRTSNNQNETHYIIKYPKCPQQPSSKNHPMTKFIANLLSSFSDAKSAQPQNSIQPQVTLRGLLEKTLALCSIFSQLQKISYTRTMKHKKQLFSKHRHQKNRQVKLGKTIRGLDKFIGRSKIKSIIAAFYTNYKMLDRLANGCERINKIYNTVVTNYGTNFIYRLIQYVGSSAPGLNSRHRGLLIKHCFSHLQQKYNQLINHSFHCINVYNFNSNPFLKKWVRCWALRTKCNLETSFWRLRTFQTRKAQIKQQHKLKQAQRQIQIQFLVQTEKAKQKERQMQVERCQINLHQKKQQQNKQTQKQILQKSLLNNKPQQKIQLSQSISFSGIPESPSYYFPQSGSHPCLKLNLANLPDGNKSGNSNGKIVLPTIGCEQQVESVLFTREQKAQILCMQLENMMDIMGIHGVIYAYTKIQSYTHPHSQPQQPQQLLEQNQPAQHEQMEQQLPIQIGIHKQDTKHELIQPQQQQGLCAQHSQCQMLEMRQQIDSTMQQIIENIISIHVACLQQQQQSCHYKEQEEWNMEKSGPKQQKWEQKQEKQAQQNRQQNKQQYVSQYKQQQKQKQKEQQ